ncbi:MULTISPECIES: hypothetical protein [Geobacillus]|uniref:Uncharacterized protein n=1 Tax=Geobacillus thermocatenulatus TaxID=33938 RepID=A0A226Q950_9BACL|nr:MULTISPECIES: hypothetical protein [Geobacillus]ASS98173.1 hypothetical protein GT3921_03365 [Geobacillus thermocatenulatus]KLR74483.1 hypothetical protein ABH20_05720 [Geobacillus sp. T6]KPD00129.1 hypothetical protein LR69_01620 [Geobacillus sp. BCO2]OXB88931.1 hypothetical protein B9L19_02215 [Geobacillus thermocatenulatus]
MEIRNVLTRQSITSPNQTLVVQKGETYDAVIKESQGGAAVVVIKGIEVQVRTEGEWPQEGRVAIKIVGEQDGVPVARIVPRPPQETDKQAVHFSASEPLSPELRQVGAWLQKHGQSLTKEIVSTLRTFFTEAPGTAEQKLDTVRAVINKHLELTGVHLAAVHEALHGKPLGERLVDMVEELKVNEQKKFRVSMEGKLDGSASTSMSRVDFPQEFVQPLLQRLTALLSETHQKGNGTEMTQAIHLLRDKVLRAIEQLKKEPHLEQALDLIQKEIGEGVQIHPAWSQAFNEALTEARQSMENGRELAARKVLFDMLSDMEQTFSSGSSDHVPLNGAWMQASVPMQTKDFLVQTVTAKMAQTSRDFQIVKRHVMRHLETVLHWMEQGGQAARLQTKQYLESAIKQLDNVILKSNLMLFTDMATEKQLMKASSQLAEAKKRLRQGDEQGARKLVNGVKETLANMELKLSEAKVKHFVAGLGEPQTDLSETFFRQMNEAAQPFVDGPSARQLFEALRRFGFTHDYEAAESLVQKDANGEGTPQNMKAMLLQLAQSGNEPIARQAEQALTNLTGQQLLNRWDAGVGMQSLFFSLPLRWQHDVRNVNVYVNARQDGERIDWENCQLYFLLETKKLGDLGILLQANERNLSITLRNDRDDFAEKAAPFIDMAKKRLEEIGYHVKTVNVDKLTNETKREEEEKRASSVRLYGPFTERGYDFTI